MSSCGSMPAVGVPVTLRMLSAPEPREHSPRSWMSLDQGDAVPRLDLAHLQVGTRRHVGVAAGVSLGEVGKARQLPVLEDAVGNAQPTHVGLLRRRAVEQAEEAPTEVVVGLRRRVGRSLRLQLPVTVEGMQLALELLGVRELLAGLEKAVLRLQAGAVRADRLAARRSPRAVARRGPSGGASSLQAGREAFEVELLLCGKVAAHRLVHVIGPWGP